MKVANSGAERASSSDRPPRKLEGAVRIALVVLVALTVVRVFAAVWIVPPVVADAQGYTASAMRLVRIGSFAYPLYTSGAWARDGRDLVITDEGDAALASAPRNAYTMPGYPGILAGLWWVTGVGSSRLLWARVLQAIMSVGTAGLMFLLGRRFSDAAGLTALMFAAVYPPFTLANSYLLTEVPYTFLLTAFVWVFLHWVDRPTSWLAAAAGVVFSLGLWVRPSHAIWVVLACAVVLLFRRTEFRKRALQVLVMGLAALVVIAPWWVRNYSVYQRFIPFTTSASVNGTEAIRRDTAEQIALPWLSASPGYTASERKIAALSIDVANRAPQSSQSDTSTMEYYSAASPALVGRVLREYPAVLLKARLRSVFSAVVTPFAVSREAVHGVAFLVSWIVQLALLALFLWGALTIPRRLDAILLLSVPLYFLALHAILIPINRYLYPAAPAALVIAAIGFVALLPSWLGEKTIATGG